MKNLFTLKTAVILTIMLLFSEFPALANGGGEEKGYQIEEHLLKNYLLKVSLAEEAKTFKFYDSKDNLIYEVTVKPEQQMDRRLVKLLNESDFLTEVSDEKLHRLKR